MATCFFVTDLHGQKVRFEKLFSAIAAERPAGVFVGGDLLPTNLARMTRAHGGQEDFISNVLVRGFVKLREELDENYPRVFLILGNDDGFGAVDDLIRGEHEGLWEYIHGRHVDFDGHPVYGYNCVPPTPFQHKDWERYDVSLTVPPGSVAPEEGHHSPGVSMDALRKDTIKSDLEILVGTADVSKAIFLFHTPPYQCALDRAELDGRSIDGESLDVHVGSAAVRRFLEIRGPKLSLHGHIHESTRITGDWKEKLGPSWCYQAAHHGAELALVRFDPQRPEEATRELL